MKAKSLILGLSLIVFGFQTMAWNDNSLTKKKTHTAPKSAAGCAPANGLEYLNFNNVNALIETGGSMYQDRPNSAAAYEIPKESGQTSIYSGSLWMGGVDANDQLKIAAVTFRNGTNDFWTGPLTTDDLAEISPDVCTEYDHFFHITRQEVNLFIAWWNCKQNNVGCEVLPVGYKIPKVILDWPAHGDESLNQDFYLAPFFDNNGDGLYDPEGSGDYPYYDVNGDIDCRVVRDIRLFGDDTYWWVFNDKGNIHTETNGASIGMEVRAQAFAFATNDEVNNMTFGNYELINRSTFTLYDTYFAQWLDPDVGCADDDYVGCDVMRGLGYAFNGDGFDQDCRGVTGYADRPPAVGLDFFEGPYQDDDGINNNYGIEPGEALNGIGYYNPLDAKPDTIVDNERYGMRRFIYYNRGGGPLGDASSALDHYNYMRSIWKDGSKMVFGGQGRPGTTGATDLEADFMFPGNSDPLNWGTQGVEPGFEWDEVQAGNRPFDRRFLQSAGPFRLDPGAVNDITVGVVWAQAVSGSNTASINDLITADQKAQALFDNCFEILDGPDAPDICGTELDQQIIICITNAKGLSNNYKTFPGDYEEVDPFIVPPPGEVYDNKYRFQGYQIYQVSGPDVSITDIGNLDKVRPVFQCDIRDTVADIINYEFDEELNATVPRFMVKDAANDGIFTTFSATEDLFSGGDPRLVNFKTYYYMAIAYAYNNYKPYKELAGFLDGQKEPYLSSRKSISGAVKPVGFTPHPQQPHNGGTIINSSYGDQPEITRIEGRGNGGNYLVLTPETSEEIMAASDYSAVLPTYTNGHGPVDVKVVDPTNVTNGNYFLQIYDEDADNDYSNSKWKMWREGAGSMDLNDTVFSDADVSIENEQIISKWGISVNLKNVADPGGLLESTKGINPNYKVGYQGSSIKYSDSSSQWLSGVEDVAGEDDQNWIRSGTALNEGAPGDPPPPSALYNSYFVKFTTADPDDDDLTVMIDAFGVYETILNGTWAPFRLCAYTDADATDPSITVSHAPTPEFMKTLFSGRVRMEDIQSVDVVLTDDESLWTRCPVLELQEELIKTQGGDSLPAGITTLKGLLRRAPSVGKDGQPDGTGMGMSWFPGYAINVETGERLNMAFGEDSWLGDQNGTDMIWNPTSTLEEGFVPNDPQRNREKKWGGKHYVYVFGNSKHFDKVNKNLIDFPKMGAYDQGARLQQVLTAENFDIGEARKTWATCLWVGMPTLTPNKALMESDVKIELRVDKSYQFLEHTLDTLSNNGLPMYTWDMESLKTVTNHYTTASDALDMIRVVPNPYYAFAEHYEQSQLDNFVKITNLPERCKVSIYNTNGTLIRSFNKSDPTTEQLWDLKNQSSVPIAGGLYIIHVDVPGVGEKIVKWFGVLRPVDLQGF